jgi:hypothetical protein
MKSISELNGASFSTCEKYRFSLWRIWNEGLPKAMCIGLNPSTANADKDDPTINNLKRALSKLGFGGFVMVNCFPIISSKPDILKGIDINDPENTDNHYFISDLAEECQEVIFAWGNFDIVSEKGIDKRWEAMFANAKCFGKNKNGTPCHPLALMYSGRINSPQLMLYKTEKEQI